MGSLAVNSTVPYQLIIVNNSPDDPAIYPLAMEGVVILDAPGNIGYGRGCNLGLMWVYQQDPQAIVWLINPDAYLRENSLDQAWHFWQHYPEVAILGTVIYEPNGQLWFAGGEFNPQNGWIAASQTLKVPATVAYQPMPWVSGCSLFIHLKCFSECPQFDPDYFLYYEDFDLCQRYQKQGYLVAFTPHISVVHYPSSITQRNPDLKFKQGIYSYLIALEKHTVPGVFWYRVIRITLVSCFSLITHWKLATAKLGTLWQYFQTIRKTIVPQKSP